MAAVSFVCQRGPEADSHVSEYEADRTPVKPSDDPSPNQQGECSPAEDTAELSQIPHPQRQWDKKYVLF